MKIAICDSELNFLSFLKEYLELYFITRNLSFKIDAYSEGAELLKKDVMKYDVFFICMKAGNMDGTALALEIRARGSVETIVFLSEHADFSRESYKLREVKYLIKPDFDEMITECMDVILESLYLRYNILEISSNGIKFRIAMSDILYIENEKRKVYIHTHDHGGKVYSAYVNIGNLVKQLKDKNFIHCHQGYIVNANAIKGVLKNEFLLSGDVRVPISRLKYKEAVKEYYSKALKMNIYYNK